jgi:hypothetical protein
VSRELLSVDMAGILDSGIRSDRDDGKLHPSTHLAAPLRHAQLDRAGAPKKERPFADQMTLHIGTLVHEWMHDEMRRLGVPYMAEVNLGPWMPEGWNGTADAVVWSPEHQAFVLVDWKTTKGESLRYREMGGASEEHILQTSIYWHALKKMGLPLVKAIAVLYIPKNQPRTGDASPLLVDFDPLPYRTLTAQMKKRREAVDKYLVGLPKPNPRPLLPEEFLTDDLAPEPEMEQRIYRDKASGDTVLKLVPTWQTKFCPYEVPICDCSSQSSTTIGRYDESGSYTPRKGFEDVAPLVTPDE